MSQDGANQRLLGELFDLLRIPSISTEGGDPQGIADAAEWVASYVRRSGGGCDVVATPGNPLVVGELPASSSDAPTVLIYGHYDVQSPGPLEAWTTPPFEPDIRAGRIYARGASDDKGNFFPLLYVACEMAREKKLPVNVRVLVEGEEEIGSPSTLDWVLGDERGADCAIIFDSGSLDPRLPAITLGTRGIAQVWVSVRTGERDLHSGIYGGSALNAVHVLAGMLQAVLPGPEGLLRDELRAGVAPVPEVERRTWEALPPGDVILNAAGARPISPGSGAAYYERNWADASLDVNEIRAGEARTIVPSEARAYFTIRLAAGQDHETIGSTAERLLREGAPPGAEVEIRRQGVDAASFDPKDPALVIARRALQKATGVSPQLIRIGATLPLMAPLKKRGIPTILTGFATAEDAFHAPNESYRLDSLRAGEQSSRELLTGLAGLPSWSR